VVFYGSPLTFTGVLLPGAGLWGLLGGFFAVCALAHGLESLPSPSSRKTQWTIGVCGFVLLTIALNIHASLRRPPPALKVIASQSTLPPYPASSDLSARYARHFELMQKAKRFLESDEDFFLFPEGVAGLDEPRFRWLWQELSEQAAKKHKSIVVGASITQDKERPNLLANAALIWGLHEAEILAQAPVPVGSWRPWDDREHYPMNFNQQLPQLTVTGLSGQRERIGLIFCWEELTPWVWIRHHIHRTSVVFIMSNTWFDPSGQINAAQIKSSWAWARLSDMDWHRAVNLHPAAAAFEATVDR
jgi:hypothetical protein